MTKLNLKDDLMVEEELTDYKSTKTLTAFDILQADIEPVKWCVPEFLPEGYAILAGRPKIGKSWISLNVAVSLAMGNKVLNYFNVDEASVLYIAYEDGKRRIKKRLEILLREMNIASDSDNLKNIRLLFREFPKLDKGGLEQLGELLNSNPKIKLVIIDTLKQAMSASNKKSDKVKEEYDFGNAIQSIAEEHGITVLAIHHTTKAKYDDIFDTISGTTGVTASADTLMVLSKENGVYNLNITGRDVFENKYNMKFGNNAVWEILGVTNAIPKTNERKEILDLFKNEYGEFSSKIEYKVKDISDILRKSQSNVSHLIKGLMNDGLLERASYGKYRISKNDIDMPKNGG